VQRCVIGETLVSEPDHHSHCDVEDGYKLGYSVHTLPKHRHQHTGISHTFFKERGKLQPLQVGCWHRDMRHWCHDGGVPDVLLHQVRQVDEEGRSIKGPRDWRFEEGVGRVQGNRAQEC